jgi:hypothetical protein
MSVIKFSDRKVAMLLIMDFVLTKTYAEARVNIRKICNNMPGGAFGIVRRALKNDSDAYVMGEKV